MRQARAVRRGPEADAVVFTAFNGGPHFRFNEAISLQVNCDTQQEIDHFWSRLPEGGAPDVRQCGWLKERYGLSWQVVPSSMARLMTSGAKPADRATSAVLKMKKIDIAELERAYAG